MRICGDPRATKFVGRRTRSTSELASSPMAEYRYIKPLLSNLLEYFTDRYKTNQQRRSWCLNEGHNGNKVCDKHRWCCHSQHIRGHLDCRSIRHQLQVHTPPSKIPVLAVVVAQDSYKSSQQPHLSRRASRNARRVCCKPHRCCNRCMHDSDCRPICFQFPLNTLASKGRNHSLDHHTRYPLCQHISYRGSRIRHLLDSVSMHHVGHRRKRNLAQHSNRRNNQVSAKGGKHNRGRPTGRIGYCGRSI
mmetsp:Transcript_14221/g.20849  ORF Transcript_14221/g.20849 Transcript_14221/m.20849 type:complete len:247 (+) Transcript_14221:279-1019(+)